MILLIIFLLLLSATFSGLTIGMFSLSPSSLERKCKIGNKQAERVLSVRKKGNLLLSTLLMSNAAINSIISILLGDALTGIMAGIVATILIFLFGEVLPQAAFSKHALYIGSKTAWIVKIFLFICYPIAKPIAIALDKLFGEDFSDRYDKSELELLLEDHNNKEGGPLDADENRILLGAMQFSDKTVKEILTPINIVFRLQDNVILDKHMLAKIKEEHYSRIPVYEDSRDDIVGILFAKDLIGYETVLGKTVSEMCVKDKLLFVGETMKLDTLLNHLISKKCHIAFVYNENQVLMGLVSLEDVIEEILKVEIMDETDTIADLQHLAKNSKNKNILHD